MKNENKKTIIAIVGPTASGKTSLAVELAKQLNTEIISADSRQIYKEFDIATAKPTKEEMQSIKHHMIDFVPPTEDYTVADFKDQATIVLEELFKQNKTPIVAGGTGLYFRILLENYDMPRVAPNKELREEFHKIEQEQGVETLYKILLELDPIAAQNIHPNNTVKIVRALEVCKTLGIPMSQAQKIKSENEYNIIWIGLGHLNGDDRQILYNKIDNRVDVMLKQGLENEAQRLFTKYGHIKNIEKTIGYQEFIDYFEGTKTKEEAIAEIKQNTRHYAKRQLTWFRRNKNINWLDSQNNKENLIKNCLNIIE